jgi:vitamin B12 transporter
MPDVRVLVLGLALPTLLPAQQADTTRLPELVVTATRAAWDADAIPAATTVLRGEDLRARGVRFVSEALREVPGMVLVQTGSYGAVTSAFMRGGESDYVKVLVDGIPLNAPGGALNLADLSLDDIERIEVVRGPASVLYGADAMSGIVQLFTRQGGGRLHGEAAVRGGSFGNREASARASGGAGRWRVSAAGSQFGSEGLYEFNNDYRSTVGSVRADVHDGRGGSLALTARLGDVRAAFPTNGSGMPVDRNQFTTEASLLLGLEARRPIGRTVIATVHGFARRVDAGAQNRPDAPADTIGFGFDADRDARTWRRGAEARMDWSAAPMLRLSVGTGIEREAEEQTSRIVSDFGFGIFAQQDTFAADRTTHHLLAQLLAEPARAVALQVGVRVDDNSAFGTFTTARIGITVRPIDDARVWVSAGTAFKAPTFSELFAASAFEVGNAALVPEQSRNVELGAERTLDGGRFVVGATVFRQQFRDLIQYVSAPAGAPTYANLQGADVRGLEAAVSVRPSRRLAVRAHWTWLDTEVTDTGATASVVFTQGASLLRRPGTSGGLTGTALVAGGTLGLAVTRIGSRADADFRDFPAARVTLPSYTLVDASLDLPVVRRGTAGAGIDLTLRAENLFDRSYDQVVGFPGRGRTVMGGGRVRF